jgi:hypothetical protein
MCTDRSPTSHGHAAPVVSMMKTAKLEEAALLVSTTVCRAALGIALWLAPVVAVAETAEYRVTFESTWSAQTHPFEFPSNAHFSGLIGGTHNDGVSFWQWAHWPARASRTWRSWVPRPPSRRKCRRRSPQGRRTPCCLVAASAPHRDRCRWLSTSTRRSPLVTLVSMLAPSPDWFVGVSALSLRANRAWIPQVVVDLVCLRRRYRQRHVVRFAQPAERAAPSHRREHERCVRVQ